MTLRLPVKSFLNRFNRLNSAFARMFLRESWADIETRHKENPARWGSEPGGGYCLRGA